MGDERMKVVKNIHNNISLCLDSKGNELIAFGKGIGFKKPPYDIQVSEVERTFYNVNSLYVDMLSQIPEEIVNISTAVIDYANNLVNGKYSNNLIFTLADHIWFSIKRHNEKIYVKLPLVHEVKHMYPEEIKIGEFALKLIVEQLDIKLPRDEAAVITLHIVGYGLSGESETIISNNQTKIEKCTKVVEDYMNLKIDKEGFNYSRFVSHMYFLLDRVDKNKEVSTDNHRIFEKLIHEYPKTYECSKKICEVLKVKLNDEEVIYLILHVNRLSSREEIME